MAWIEKAKVVRYLQPSYSPDISQYDFDWFQALKSATYNVAYPSVDSLTPVPNKETGSSYANRKYATDEKLLQLSLKYVNN